MDNGNGVTNYFVILMVTTQQKQKVNTCIELSTNPLLTLQQKNKNKRDYSSDGDEREPWEMEVKKIY